MFAGWARTGGSAGNAVCDLDPSCSETRVHFQLWPTRVLTAASIESTICRQLQSLQDKQSSTRH